MPLLILSLLGLLSLAQANFDSVSIKSLNLDYTAPHGKGTLEKFKIGFSLLEPEPTLYPVEIHRIGKGLLIQTPNVEVTWEQPGTTIHDAERVTTQNFNMDLGNKTAHTISADSLILQPPDMGMFTLTNASIKCVASSVRPDFQVRAMDDCINDLELEIKKLDIPTDSFLVDIFASLPQILDEELPASDFWMQSKKGEMYLEVGVKYYVRAKLRAWGHVQYEDNYNTLAIRIDQIKYGVLPVTSVVMKALKNRIKNPSIKVDPPWIRVSLK